MTDSRAPRHRRPEPAPGEGPDDGTGSSGVPGPLPPAAPPTTMIPRVEVDLPEPHVDRDRPLDVPAVPELPPATGEDYGAVFRRPLNNWDDRYGELSWTGVFPVVDGPAWMGEEVRGTRFVESDRARRPRDRSARAPRTSGLLRGKVRPGVVVRRGGADAPAEPLEDLPDVASPTHPTSTHPTITSGATQTAEHAGPAEAGDAPLPSRPGRSYESPRGRVKAGVPVDDLLVPSPAPPATTPAGTATTASTAALERTGSTSALDGGPLDTDTDTDTDTGADRVAPVEDAAPDATSAPQPAGGSIGRIGALMASGSMVSRILGLVRNMMLTMCLGGYLINDAFSSANILPNYIYILLAGGLLNAILIPQITKAMKSPGGGQEQVDRLLTLVLVVIGAVGLGVTVLAKPIIGVITAYSGSTFDLAVAFAVLTMPQVLFYCLYVLFGQVLNARGQFAAFMWAPVLANVVQILGMGVWLAQYSGITTAQRDPTAWSPGMIWWLAGTSTLGIAVQALVLVVPLWRGGFRYRPRFDFRGHGLREAGSMVGWAFGALLVSQAGGLFAQWVLTHVTDGRRVVGYGVYTAMFTIFMIPHSLVTTTLVTALFPRLANAVHDRDVEGQRAIVRRCLTTPAVAIIPLTGAALALGRPGIRLLNPGYSDAAVTGATLVFAAMVLGMWPFGIKSLQERYTFAREDGPGTLRFQAITSGVALVFTLLALVVPAEHAAATVALGLSVSSLVGAAAFVRSADAELGDLRLGEVGRLYGRLSLVAIASGLVTWLVATGLGAVLGSGLVASLAVLLVGGAVFAAVVVAVARALHVTEIDELLSPVLRRLRRAAPASPTA